MVVEILAGAFVGFIQSAGYLGVFMLMVGESMILPIPSELVLPFAGYVVAQGGLDALGVHAAALLGTGVGSLLSYYLGKWVSREVLVHHGKWIGLKASHLHWTEKWFAQHGGGTIFVGRFIPVVRHLISIPAGMSRMPRRQFLAMTLVGGGLWNGFLITLGYMLRGEYALIYTYSSQLDYLVLGILFVIVIWIFLRQRNN